MRRQKKRPDTPKSRFKAAYRVARATGGAWSRSNPYREIASAILERRGKVSKQDGCICGGSAGRLGGHAGFGV